MKRLALILIIVYQHTIGRVMPRVCRYEPTCSNYARQAIERFGLVRGFALGVWRIIRCNPFWPGGIDPVPEHFGGKSCAQNR